MDLVEDGGQDHHLGYQRRSPGLGQARASIFFKGVPPQVLVAQKIS